jgi:hypothetical protein
LYTGEEANVLGEVNEICGNKILLEVKGTKILDFGRSFTFGAKYFQASRIIASTYTEIPRLFSTLLIYS